MADPKAINPKYAIWSVRRRMDEATRKVVREKWTFAEACREYGVSRSGLALRVKTAKEDYTKRLVEAQDQATPEAKPLVGKSGKVVPATFQEFDDYYFAHWICPDCETTHARKPFHDEIVDAIQSSSNRVVINVPPFHAKSTYGTVKSVIYQIVRNPNIRIVIISKTQDLAKAFLESIKELLTNEELYEPGKNLIQDFGPFKSDEKETTWSATKINIANRVTHEKDPTVRALGVGNQIYGARADVIIADDTADLDNQRNPEQVEKMLGWFDKMVSSRVGKKGKVVWIGTRVHHGDIYSTLRRRTGYNVIEYSAILDETNETVLWPEHFPYTQLMVHQAEMSVADFQLIYQNVDIPGLHASFTDEILDGAKDPGRVLGHFEPEWKLIAGLDPAGAGRGIMSFTVLGIDPTTGCRYVVDQYAEKGMKAPAMRDLIFDWTDRYPIYEWRVEANGIQAQLVQYNDEIIKFLAHRGVRVVPHVTGSNKWDAKFGVEAMAPLFSTGLFNVPWGNQPTCAAIQPLLDQLRAFPMAAISDRVMSTWFAEIGCKSILERNHLPLFNERMKIPDRIRRRRRVVDFHDRQVVNVPLHEQRRNHLFGGRPEARRLAQGRPTRWGDVREVDPNAPRKYVNVPGWVDPD